MWTVTLQTIIPCAIHLSQYITLKLPTTTCMFKSLGNIFVLGHLGYNRAGICPVLKYITFITLVFKKYQAPNPKYLKCK